MGKPNPENLVPYKWKKGQSGNPNGRPKKLPLIKDLMALILGEEKEGKTAAEQILKVIRASAAKGNVKAAEFLFHYAYGKPTQKVENVGEPTEIRIIRE